MSSHPAADPGARRNGSPAPERHAYEQALAARGIRLPLPHRAGWGQARRGVESLWLPLGAPDGSNPGAIAVDVGRARSLPGYRHLRVERLGETLPRAVWRDAVAALAALARQEARVLLLSVEVFSRDPETRATLGALLTEAGFTRAAQPRNWGVTLALDLRPSEAELMASFSRSLRQRLTGIAKLPVAVRPVDDERCAPRLEELTRQAFQRTGGRYEALWDWAGVIALSRRSPDASRLVGLFRTDRDGTDALLGFAWGWWNGASASYFAGATTRPSDLQVPIAHALVWDLICWAKREGADWFDLGGVSAGTTGSADPVGGISDFKRQFSKETVEVAEDWTLEPRLVPARLAALVSAGAAWFSRVARG